MVMKIEDFREIPLGQIKIGTSQARTRDVDKGVDELAHSINKVGLLEPPVVAPESADGKFEIITGQRRFLAVSRLGWDSVRCGVLSEPPTESLAKAISITENMVRQDMHTSDYIDACTALFRQYGSIKAVSEELGLPQSRVSQYVKFDQLVVELQEKVKAGDLEMNTALRATKAATKDGEVNKEKAVLLAEEMSEMSGAQQKQLEKVSAHNPEASVEEILEKSRKQPKVKTMSITLEESLTDGLGAYAHEEGTEPNEAAVNLITQGLLTGGYIDE